MLEVVAIYKDLRAGVERGSASSRTYWQCGRFIIRSRRVKAHILWPPWRSWCSGYLRRLEEAGIDFSADRAMEALETVRLVTFRMGDRPERVAGSAEVARMRGVLKALKLTELKPPASPEGEADRDVVTIRKFESCTQRGYVEAPQTWAMAGPRL